MLSLQAKIEVICTKHPAPERECAACTAVRRLEVLYTGIVDQRAHFLEQLRQALGKHSDLRITRLG